MATAEPNGGSSGYSTSFQTMAQGAEAVRTAHTSIRKTLGDLEADVSTMLGGWQGDAASAFVAVQGRWNQLAERINTALDGIQQSLEDTRTDYRRQEQTESEQYSFINLGGQ